jgi:ER lumen protein retaining receptor
MSFVLWLFEIGYILQHAATLYQINTMLKKKKSELVSLETNLLFLMGACSRLIWIWDSMLKGFFLSYIEIILAFASLVYIIYLHQKFKVNNMVLNEVRLPIYLRIEVLIPVILLLSFFFHPGTKGAYYFTSQMFVSLSIYAESIGLLPQLHMIHQEKDTGSLSQYYVVLLAFARFFRLLFWLKMYLDGNKFISLILADLVHCALISNFVYNVFKNFNSAILPTSSDSYETKPKKMY